MSEVKCPKCGSKQISANKKGFSGGKAAAGAILTGGIGLLAGTIGKDDVIITCLACGHQWEPKDLVKQIQVKEYQDLKEWKRDFYAAYEAKEFDRAENIFLSKRTFNKAMPDVHGAYAFLKKGDRQLMWFTVGFVAVIVLIVYFIVS